VRHVTPKKLSKASACQWRLDYFVAALLAMRKTVLSLPIKAKQSITQNHAKIITLIGQFQICHFLSKNISNIEIRNTASSVSK
jgi:hypothetical protein